MLWKPRAARMAAKADCKLRRSRKRLIAEPGRSTHRQVPTYGRLLADLPKRESRAIQRLAETLSSDEFWKAYA